MRAKKEIVYKKCAGESLVKNGLNKEGVQGYKCKGCGLSFIEEDKRIRQELVFKRALAVILYNCAKAFFIFFN